MNSEPLFTQNEINIVKQSQEAKVLLERLQKNGASGVSQASDALQKGDYGKAAALMKPLLETPDMENLLRELSKKLGRA